MLATCWALSCSSPWAVRRNGPVALTAIMPHLCDANGKLDVCESRSDGELSSEQPAKFEVGPCEPEVDGDS